MFSFELGFGGILIQLDSTCKLLGFGNGTLIDVLVNYILIPTPKEIKPSNIKSNEFLGPSCKEVINYIDQII